MTDPLDVLVIGGGQAGLVLGYELARRSRRFLIADAGTQIGHSWRSRWDSLHLFTPAQFDNLPGMPFPASSDTYPGKDDVADFLQAYALRFELPVQLNTRVTSLTRTDNTYVAATGGDALRARQVVIATGPFDVPFVPPIAKDLDPDVTQIHSVDYRNPRTLPAGTVLVVGAANSGCQIALDMSATHRCRTGSRPTDSDDPSKAAGPRRVVVGERAEARPGHRGLPTGKAPGRARPSHRDRSKAARQASRSSDPASGDDGAR